MATKVNQYWVGSIPAEPLSITVRDSQGRNRNLSSYSAFKVRLVGSDNEEIDVSDGTLITAGAVDGRFVFRFPNGRSVFTKPGEYLLQLEMGGNGVRDFTDTHTIRVRRLGGNK